MRKLFQIAAACVALAACGVNPEDATRALEAMGFTNIEFTGTRVMFTGCSERDSRATGFRAIGVNGQPIEGVVCAGLTGWDKGVTVRFD